MTEQEHYFSKKPKVASNKKTVSCQLRGKSFTFISDRGVFSKNDVDFGSRLLIEHFRLPEVPGDILDIGCGYGPIGIAIASTAKDRSFLLVDVNERAVELATANAKANGVANVVVKQSNLFTEIEKTDFAAIMTNPPIRAGKKVVYELFEQAAQHLITDGELWIVIQKKQGALSALEKLATLFDKVEVVAKKKGYYIIQAVKKFD